MCGRLRGVRHLTSSYKLCPVSDTLVLPLSDTLVLPGV